ncbi:hypothetical protein D3C74_265790 [compost metagenome]
MGQAADGSDVPRLQHADILGPGTVDFTNLRHLLAQVLRVVQHGIAIVEAAFIKSHIRHPSHRLVAFNLEDDAGQRGLRITSSRREIAKHRIQQRSDADSLGRRPVHQRVHPGRPGQLLRTSRPTFLRNVLSANVRLEQRVIALG